jgi:hypothetical protein
MCDRIHKHPFWDTIPWWLNRCAIATKFHNCQIQALQTFDILDGISLLIRGDDFLPAFTTSHSFFKLLFLIKSE